MDARQRRDNLRSQHVPRTTASIGAGAPLLHHVGGGCCSPEDRQPAHPHRVERQHAVVLQQRHRLCGGALGQPEVLLAPLGRIELPAAWRRATRPLIQAHAKDGRQHPDSGLAHSTHRGVPTELEVRKPEPVRLLHVEALLHSLCAVRCSPIGHHKALKAHLALQVSQEEIPVLARSGSIDPVVGAHHCCDAGLNRCFERWVVQLPGCTRIHIGALVPAFRLLLVESKVLDHSHDAFVLQSLDVRLRKACAQVGILSGEVLEVPAVLRHAVHIHGGPEHDVGSLALELLGDGDGRAVHQMVVPSGRDGEQAREAGDAAVFARVRGPEALSSVLHLQRGNGEAGDGPGVAREVLLLRPQLRGPKARALHQAPLFRGIEPLRDVLSPIQSVGPRHEIHLVEVKAVSLQAELQGVDPRVHAQRGRPEALSKQGGAGQHQEHEGLLVTWCGRHWKEDVLQLAE
mmetsp:Transcript_103129/g.287071  ORF Transcript_103129/g.287071 Transcript_103129/m.287071 type:complete len:459 (+) Transcript_103129:1051-2427(+)